MLPLLLLLAPLVSLALQIPLRAPTSAPPSLLPPSFDSFAEAVLEEWGVPGLAVGVIRVEEGDEARVEFHGYGKAREGRKVDEDTLFGIASNTKAFTSAAVGQLVEEGRFSWEDKVAAILPEFELLDAFASERSSLVDLLSHRTGLPRHEMSYHIGQDSRDVVERLRFLRPSRELRESWQYNNQMFVTAARLVSRLTSLSFTSYVRSRFLEPLNMSSTTFSPHLDGPAAIDRLSASFLTLDNGTTIEIPYGFNYTHKNLELNAGAGGIVSSTRDLVKWVELLIRQRRRAIAHDNSTRLVDRVLAPATVRQLTRAHTLMERDPPFLFGNPRTYGMGFMSHIYNGSEYIYHGGNIPGFGSQIAWSSEAGVGIVALCNSAGFRGVAEKAKADREEALRKALKHKPTTAPTLPLPHYLGAYFDPGYGNLTACPAPGRNTSFSSTCDGLYRRIADALPASIVPPSSTVPVILLVCPGYFGMSHFLLRHYDGDVWKGSAASIFEGTQASPGRKLLYESADAVRVEFVLDARKERVLRAEVSGVWGAGGEVEPDEERVEVAFLRESYFPEEL
ncbi:hypothetical protein JCM10213v2_005023 [Rhodosporidiobolus nylandii]